MDVKVDGGYDEDKIFELHVIFLKKESDDFCHRFLFLIEGGYF